MTSLKPFESNIILVVIDPANRQDLLLDYLKGFGFKMLIATDGESALDMAFHAQPDIILLDAILPGIDGFETCRRLKARIETRDIPVIFITAQTNTVNKVRGFSLGAVDYISRPIQSEEVLARLRTHLTLQNLQNSLEEQNEQLQQEIEERGKLIAELDAFAHTVAHDLKNPLGITIGHGQHLRKYHARMTIEEFEYNLDQIVKNSHKMRNIIDELLLLSGVRTGEINPEPLNMAEIVEEAIERLSFLVEEYQATIVTPDMSQWPAAWGHSPWIEEVWINYISNAIKYGGHPPRVELGARLQENGLVCFWVKDNGDGLTPQAQGKLFIPFNRVNQVRAEGHGLGLSIVQRIIKKLGGQVSVASAGQPGEGSVFSFCLPVYTADSSSD